MKKILAIIVLGLAFAATSCSNFFELKRPNQFPWQSAAELEMAVRAPYLYYVGAAWSNPIGALTNRFGESDLARYTNPRCDELIDKMRVESDMLHQDPDFDTAALARLLGVSQERLNRLFRRQTIYRTPEAYIDNIRLLSAMRMLREQPNYTIAVIAEEAGFGNVRTLQRRFQEAIGMTPVEYRLMMTRDN